MSSLLLCIQSLKSVHSFIHSLNSRYASRHACGSSFLTPCLTLFPRVKKLLCSEYRYFELCSFLFFFSSLFSWTLLSFKRKENVICHGTSQETPRMASDKLKSSEDGPSQGTDLEMMSLSMADINEAL